MKEAALETQLLKAVSLNSSFSCMHMAVCERGTKSVTPSEMVVCFKFLMGNILS